MSLTLSRWRSPAASTHVRFVFANVVRPRARSFD